MNIHKEIQALDKKRVYIHFNHEHYKNGSNCNFSVEFVDKNGKHLNQTGWWGDNHEFGDVADATVAAIKIAKWLAKDNKFKKYFEHCNETITKKGHAQWKRVQAFRDKFEKYINRLTIN